MGFKAPDGIGASCWRWQGDNSEDADHAPWAEVASGTTNSIWSYSEARGVVAFLLFLTASADGPARSLSWGMPNGTTTHPVLSLLGAAGLAAAEIIHQLQRVLKPLITQEGTLGQLRADREEHLILVAEDLVDPALSCANAASV